MSVLSYQFIILFINHKHKFMSAHNKQNNLHYQFKIQSDCIYKRISLFF